jgi:hypothetical protein
MINSSNYIQLIITPYSTDFTEEKQHGYIMHENARTHTALENTFRAKVISLRMAT